MSSPSKPLHVAVAVVGGGPSGLLLSLLLRLHGVQHVVIERRVACTSHPQAHFINARSMEILQAFPNVHRKVLEQSPSSHDWRDFSYCYSVTGREYARVDHFSDPKSKSLWTHSPTQVAHLPQSLFENILRNEVIASDAKIGSKGPMEDSRLFFGYEVFDVVDTKNDSRIHIRPVSGGSQSHNGECIIAKYVIAADGANSFIRQQLNIKMTGERNLQTLMNIHFKCPGLYPHLKPRPAMLYFTFNEKMIAVFVAHILKEDVWVCQIPIFPPYQTLEDYSMDQLKEMICHGLGITSMPDLCQNIKILHTGTWMMNAEVAETFTNQYQNIFLIGDSAHRFPPSGGFGMNSGLQDAHNIAWKLASVVHGTSDSSLLSTYAHERRDIAMKYTQLSMINYHKTTKAATMLGMDASLAQIAYKTAKNASFVPLSLQKGLFLSAMNVGLASLKGLREKGNYIQDLRVSMLRRFIDSGESLPLLFPLHDLGFGYDSMMRKNQPKARPSNGQDSLKVGFRFPHIWLAVSESSTQEGKPFLLNIDSSSRPCLVMASTVDICLAIDVDSMAATRCIPYITVFVSSKHYSRWSDVLKTSFGRDVSSLFRVVAIHQCSAINEDSFGAHQTKSRENIIEELQERLQNPRYDHVADDKKGIDRLQEPPSFNEMNVITIKHAQQYSIQLPSVDHYIDICDGWNSLTDSYESQGDIAVVVRPDGHIAQIFRADESLEDISSTLSNIFSFR